MRDLSFYSYKSKKKTEEFYTNQYNQYPYMLTELSIIYIHNS